MRSVLLCASLVLLTACPTPPSSSMRFACKTDLDCTGEACVGGFCAVHCASASDCIAGEQCIDSVCTVPSAPSSSTMATASSSTSVASSNASSAVSSSSQASSSVPSSTSIASSASMEASSSSVFSSSVMSSSDSVAGSSSSETSSSSVMSSSSAPSSSSGNGPDLTGLRVVFSTPPRNSIKGACSQRIIVGLEDANNLPVDIPAGATIRVTTPSTTLTPSSQGCMADLGVVIPVTSAMNWQFTVHGSVEETTSITVEIGNATPGTQAVTVVPMVRRGTCAIAEGQTSVMCPISPPLTNRSNSFLVFQTEASSTTDAAGAKVMCVLPNGGRVDCKRVGTLGSVDITWQVAEFTSGVSVQHVEGDCTGATMASPYTVTYPINPVRSDQSFILFSSMGGGPTLNEMDFRVVYFDDATTDEPAAVIVRTNRPCAPSEKHSIQVVRWIGSIVRHEQITSWNSMVTSTMNDTSLVGDRAFPLVSWRPPPTYAANNSGCAAVRGEVRTDDVEYTRQSGCDMPDEGIQELRSQIVEMPAGATSREIPIAMNTSSVSDSDANIGGDLSRTIFLMAGQWTSGQSWGRGDAATNQMLRASTARVTPVLDNGDVDVTVTRAADHNSAASFFVYAAELPQQP